MVAPMQSLLCDSTVLSRKPLSYFDARKKCHFLNRIANNQSDSSIPNLKILTVTWRCGRPGKTQMEEQTSAITNNLSKAAELTQLA